MTALSPAVVEAITRAALARGDLRVLMTRTQLITLDKIDESKGQTFLIECSRRWGKTRFAAMRSFACALEAPGNIIRYGAPTKHHGRVFVQPAFDWVASKLPDAMRPAYDRMDSCWRWKNGSVCHLGSAESMADVESQVGTECHLAIGDEAAKWRSDLLAHWHKSVILPQFLTTRGSAIILSTPPITGGHYFATLCKTSEIRRTFAKYTVDDCDHITEEARRDMIREIVAPEATEWEPWMDEAALNNVDIRRELYCERLSDPSRMIVPEWMAVAADCTEERKRPSWLDWYCAGDFGFEDLSVVLWGWYDFERGQLVIEDELAMHRASGLDVGFAVREKEAQLGIRKVVRVADATPQLLADLADGVRGPGINFGPAMKDDAVAALNHLRTLIQRKRIVVNPRCTTLINHLAFGVWNSSKTGFERVDGFGHWDAIDAIKYMSRQIDWTRNPVPALANGENVHTHYIPPDVAKRDADARLREAFR